ncbi:MAG: 1-deoxy-D-xylulose-5-phosphate reductoisomerase [Alphaproteobacteria bacterium]|nr:1-deoxy-D-xylulose-5-phosphate reductoisomerase [Alphaproteobacteria bacterium]
MTAKRVTILGATGSVGANTLSVIGEHRERFRVVALAAGRNADLLAQQARAFRPEFAAIAEPGSYAALKEGLAGTGIETAAGPEAVVEAARRDAEWVMAAISGAAGLESTLAAIERGAVVALANKESLVCAGELMMAAARASGSTILPVDSEHNAIFQVFDAQCRDAVRRLILTVSGAAGLESTLAAVERGAVVALANKESLVCAGELMMAAARASGSTILPVDSEHNAIFQVFDAQCRDAVRRLILTASGGPFRSASREEMAAVRPAEALKHPNWDMGAKITIDSATMMNKGLELIEARHLFAMSGDAIDILVHPQSIVHSMVEYADGSVLAQLGTPDMRTPIAVALAWPERLSVTGERLDLAAIGRLDFEPPDPERFPALALARQALERGGTEPAALSAANEVAVAAFLSERIGFLQIAEIAGDTVAAMGSGRLAGLDDVRSADREAREVAERLVDRAAGAKTPRGGAG